MRSSFYTAREMRAPRRLIFGVGVAVGDPYSMQAGEMVRSIFRHLGLARSLSRLIQRGVSFTSSESRSVRHFVLRPSSFVLRPSSFVIRHSPFTAVPSYDAILLVSFGGPEGPDEVLPFLENVLRGKNVPRERMLEVTKHYEQFGGVSPINEQCRQLIAALESELLEHGPHLPVYWGNRNWNPLLPETLQRMADDGIKHALGFFTSAFSSYSGCRQYHEDIARARKQVGDRAPEVDKLRVFFNHPGFLEPMIEATRACLEKLPVERRAQTPLLFTAHSIPEAMADNCHYVDQLNEAARLIAEAVNHTHWELVYQSRSGPPQQPWLEPDICDRIEALHQAAEAKGQPLTDLLILPLGFISDHLEVLFDLDIEAQQLCDKLGITLQRVPTVGTHARFVQMIRELIVERVVDDPQRLVVGRMPPSHDVCARDCCLYSPGRPSAKL